MYFNSSGGQVDDPLFYKALDLVEIVQNAVPEVELRVHAIPLLEPDWIDYRNAKAKELGGDTITYKGSHMIVKDGEFVGSFEAWAALCLAEWAVTAPSVPDVHYKDRAAHEFLTTLKGTGNPFCFMEIKVADTKPRRVIFELFNTACPRTCENFMALCEGREKGLSYRGCPFHRIVPGGWIQGGDIVNGDGSGGRSIFGDTFPDECFTVPFSRPGVLAMANDGPNLNASQFFVTLAPLEAFQTRFVAFGRVVKGMTVFRRIEAMETKFEAPNQIVRVERSGVLDLSTAKSVG